jgi:N-acetyl-alpha-D-muramate 1-phosphate uridylyltransferase
MQAVILAGGLGTRLRPITEKVPKPMVLVGGKPFLEHEIRLLKKGGVDDFVVCVGYLGEMIVDYFGDGRSLGTSIRYSSDGPELLGPAGALRGAQPLLEDSFLVTYGDSYLMADYGKVMKALGGSDRLGLMTVLRNYNRYGRSDIVVKDGFVVEYDKVNQSEGMVWINFGIAALRREALALIPPGRKCGEEEFYGKLVARGQLLAFEVKNRFYGIGDEASLREFERLVPRLAKGIEPD